MSALYHQTKTLISFWCRRELNPRTLIQPLETLPVELTETQKQKKQKKEKKKFIHMNHCRSLRAFIF